MVHRTSNVIGVLTDFELSIDSGPGDSRTDSSMVLLPYDLDHQHSLCFSFLISKKIHYYLSGLVRESSKLVLTRYLEVTDFGLFILRNHSSQAKQLLSLHTYRP